VELIVSSGCAHVLGLEDQFKVAAEAGFDGFEYLVNREHVPGTTAKLIELSRHYAMPIRNVHAPFQSVPGWDGPVTSLISTVNVARAVQARSVTFHPPSGRWTESPFTAGWSGSTTSRKPSAVATS